MARCESHPAGAASLRAETTSAGDDVRVIQARRRRWVRRRWVRRAPSADGGGQVERRTEGAGNDKFAKVGRNSPCPCGSGKKYKLCHGDPRNRTND